jgi:RluA family pseudouridine synthase
VDVREWVLWQDEALLIVNKPAGLPTLVDGWQPQAPFLVGVLKEAFGRLWVVHRLDRETSGVIVLARTAEAHRILNTQFEQRQAHKTYHALVVGQPEWEQRLVSLSLRPNGDRKHRTVVDGRAGKPAETELSVLARLGALAALVEARPLSGRTHQIRVHLAAIGYPIIGDELYIPAALRGAHPPVNALLEKTTGLIGRAALHSWRLELRHPLTGDVLAVQAPYPEDFEAARSRLAGSPSPPAPLPQGERGA